MSLELVLGIMAAAETEADLKRVAPHAAKLPDQDRAIARWAYAYNLEMLRHERRYREWQAARATVKPEPGAPSA